MGLETFEGDLLDLKRFSARLTSLIDVESKLVEGSLVLPLSSRCRRYHLIAEFSKKSMAAAEHT